MPGSMLRRIKVQAAVCKFDAAVGLARDVRVVRDHQDGVARVVQFAKDLKDDLFVRFIEIAGGFVGQDDLRLIDQSARNGHALLLAAGELGREMCHSFAHAHAAQGFLRLLFIRHAVEILREHHVFECVQIRNEMKLLEDEADFFGAITDQSRSREVWRDRCRPQRRGRS